ncbi:hypothetical protein [Clostridium gelidum]|uniref:hypothetical protein n=1 Tax=Clostridium gelidum TaxID=704125 RepID=UPI001CC6ED5D|nr:hypothetical protein [Clostridium gelidum]
MRYYIKVEIKGTLLCSVASEDLAIDISSVEVVPFMLVPMYIGTSINGATFTVRNS